jgi:ABC-type multidrug transport system ATPase subunit
MKGETSGSVVFDGVALRPEEVRKRAGFVRQDDVLLHTATVHETLLTSVRLRCGHLTRSEQDARAEQVRDRSSDRPNHPHTHD